MDAPRRRPYLQQLCTCFARLRRPCTCRAWESAPAWAETAAPTSDFWRGDTRQHTTLKHSVHNCTNRARASSVSIADRSAAPSMMRPTCSSALSAFCTRNTSRNVSATSEGATGGGNVRPKVLPYRYSTFEPTRLAGAISYRHIMPGCKDV